VVDWEPKQLPWVEPRQDLTDPAKHYVVDIRDASAYSAGHIPNSVAIGLRGRLETWVGIMVPWEAKLVLVGDEKELREAPLRLHRVGYRAQLSVAARKVFLRSASLCAPTAVIDRIHGGRQSAIRMPIVSRRG
jgi:hydroxyacylglutathione hydrolase